MALEATRQAEAGALAANGAALLGVPVTGRALRGRAEAALRACAASVTRRRPASPMSTGRTRCGRVHCFDRLPALPCTAGAGRPVLHRLRRADRRA